MSKAKTSKSNPKFLCVLIAGISGAGKSQAIKCMEDFGYFCVDNLPAPLLPKFADLIVESGEAMRKSAMGIDVREGRLIQDLPKYVKAFHSRGIATWILFLDSDDSALLRRYSETRRKHPMSNDVMDGIRLERKALRDVRAQADKIIDTSNLTLSELKEMVASSLPVSVKKQLHVSVCSFGFKYGLPVDADLVWDVRFLPNPHYVANLRPKTGLNREVREYVMNSKGSRAFLTKFSELAAQCLPFYVAEGKSHLTIAIGCTGGRHRSVTIAEKLAKFLKGKGCHVTVRHRDLDQSRH